MVSLSNHVYPIMRMLINEDIIDDIAIFLYEGTVLTDDTFKFSILKKDPADNKFISCAIEGEADYIISGDEHLLNLKHYKGIQVVNASSFLKILEKTLKKK